MWWVIFLIIIAGTLLLYGTSFWHQSFHDLRVKRYFTKTHVNHHYQHYQCPAYTAQSIPRPAEIICVDFTSPSQTEEQQSGEDEILVLSWNIEMGYKIEDLVTELQKIKPKICLFQEVDLFDNGHNFCLNAFADLAKALKMRGCYSGHHEYRFGSKGRGIWGNAILSVYPCVKPEVHLLKSIVNYDRSFLICDVLTPLGPISCCSVHTEVCGGIKIRQRQLSQVVEKMEIRLAQTKRAIIAGDLNTIGDKAVRLSPFHCTDCMRVLSLGQSEASWFGRHFWPQTSFFDPFDIHSDFTLSNWLWEGKLDWILLAGLKSKLNQIGKGDESDHHWIAATVVNDENL